MLKQRIITALILAPIALGGFFLLSGWAFALFIGAVVTLGAWEWARLAGFQAQPVRVAFAAAGAVGVVVLGILWWLVATLLVLSFPNSHGFWSDSTPIKVLIGLLILLPAWQGLVLIKQWPLANWLIFAVMILVWGADIGAYFSGRKFGKRKLAPLVSPGKSWEGVYGGLAACLAITVGVGIFRGWSGGEFVFALLGTALIVAVSVVGALT